MRIILMFILLFIARFNFGQTVKDFNWHINAGTVIMIPDESKIVILPNYAKYPIYYKPNFGYFLGIKIEYNFDSKLSLLTGTNFSQTRLGVDDYFFPIVFKGNIISTFIQFPLSVKYRIINNIPLEIEIGGYFCKVFNVKEDGSVYMDESRLPPSDDIIIESKHDYESDLSDNYLTYDFGLLGQIDYNLRLIRKIDIVLFTNLNYGLIDVLKDQKYYKWKNYSIQLGIGIKI